MPLIIRKIFINPNRNLTLKDFPSCIAVGHGKDFHGDGGFYSENLKKTDKLPLWEPEDCENKLNEEFFERNHSLTWSAHSSFLCAGGELDVDTCEVGYSKSPIDNNVASYLLQSCNLIG